VSVPGAATNAGPFQFSLKMKRNLIVVLLFRAFVLAGILRIYVVACDSLNDINNIVREGNEVTQVPQREELEAPAATTDELLLSKFFFMEASPVLRRSLCFEDRPRALPTYPINLRFRNLGRRSGD
jgi:hypothetical protein